ncbi:MAG: hypothetical protein PHS65_07465 [Arcobacteraceae bacterium]|nr:hypothetical protein [Arcobacteraceae bacterium]
MMKLVNTDSQAENEKVPCSNRLQMKASEQEEDKVEQNKKISMQIIIKALLLLAFTWYFSYLYTFIRPVSYFEEMTYHIASFGVVIAIIFPRISNWLVQKLLSKKVVFTMLLLYGIAVVIAVMQTHTYKFRLESNPILNKYTVAYDYAYIFLTVSPRAKISLDKTTNVDEIYKIAKELFDSSVIAKFSHPRTYQSDGIWKMGYISSTDFVNEEYSILQKSLQILFALYSIFLILHLLVAGKFYMSKTKPYFSVKITRLSKREVAGWVLFFLLDNFFHNMMAMLPHKSSREYQYVLPTDFNEWTEQEHSTFKNKFIKRIK